MFFFFFTCLRPDRQYRLDASWFSSDDTRARSTQPIKRNGSLGFACSFRYLCLLSFAFSRDLCLLKTIKYKYRYEDSSLRRTVEAPDAKRNVIAPMCSSCLQIYSILFRVMQNVKQYGRSWRLQLASHSLNYFTLPAFGSAMSIGVRFTNDEVWLAVPVVFCFSKLLFVERYYDYTA